MSAVQVNIDPDEFTLGELEEFEELSGTSLSAVVKTKDFSAKALTALVYVTHKRGNPDFTIDDARAIKVSEIDFGEKDATDPTNADSPEKGE